MQNENIYWKRYEQGLENHRQNNVFLKNKRNLNFYEGRQWEGLEHQNQPLIALNFIKPIGKYKISMIAQSAMQIVFNTKSSDEKLNTVCEFLNDFSLRQWEKSKFDKLCWDIIKRSFIFGDVYLYTFNSKDENDKDLYFKNRIVNPSGIFFADEQNDDLQSQQYIIIEERLPVSYVKEIAKKNKLSKEKIDLIVSDDVSSAQFYENYNEVKTQEGKCTSILYLEKTKDGLTFLRSVKGVIYSPLKTVKDLSLYPIAQMKWEEKIGSIRGLSGLEGLIENQIEINKTATRRAISTKRYAYPSIVYDKDRVSKIQNIDTVGGLIAVKNQIQNPISTLIDYLKPVSISPDAQYLQNELLNITRELEGASDAATGQVDPTKASGEAIKAARDQSAVALNEHISGFKQFLEDVAIVWQNMIFAYSPKTVSTIDGKTLLKEDILYKDIDLRIDVSPIDPYSRLSRQLSLDNLFNKGAITFDEYVSLIDDTSAVPKADLERILEKRKGDANVNEEITQKQI